MTKKILEEIKFYEKFHPFELFKKGVFGSGFGIENEHLIHINLDIVDDGITLKDSFQWDIINEDNRYIFINFIYFVIKAQKILQSIL
jgi:hypothetical protein